MSTSRRRMLALIAAYTAIVFLAGIVGGLIGQPGRWTSKPYNPSDDDPYWCFGGARYDAMRKGETCDGR